jgi:exo-beta-1,3-glucanase (GH17 family)
VARPKFWKDLIVKIKKVYSGKITYAENWDVYKNVSFIDQLDYIGIDAYFPLDTNKTPTVKALAKAWKSLKTEIQQFSKKHDKKILFTEFGYQSKDYATLEPWEHSKVRVVNLKGQENALTAIFNQFWSESWFGGGFLWKWYDQYNEVGGINDSDYTVQNKPSEKIVKKYYSQK